MYAATHMTTNGAALAARLERRFALFARLGDVRLLHHAVAA
jgi:hypothetical protein